jgi:hypothetical protein
VDTVAQPYSGPHLDCLCLVLNGLTNGSLSNGFNQILHTEKCFVVRITAPPCSPDPTPPIRQCKECASPPTKQSPRGRKHHATKITTFENYQTPTMGTSDPTP